MRCVAVSASAVTRTDRRILASRAHGRSRNFVFDETSELSDYVCILSKQKCNGGGGGGNCAPPVARIYRDESGIHGATRHSALRFILIFSAVKRDKRDYRGTERGSTLLLLPPSSSRFGFLNL